jgi:hypothetical protein
LIEFFQKETATTGADARNLQVLLTSHSPNIASKVGLNQITLMAGGQAFSLRSGQTALDPTDYEFLERFLDVTKSDLFFARGLMIVEGDAEALLLPTVAELLGCPLTAAGVSIINVGSVGLFRYSKIFQRAAGPSVPVRVACLADRDIPPDAAKDMFKKPRKTEGDYSKEEIAGRLAKVTELDRGPVKTFVSPCWTLEHDLVLGGLGPEVHQAIRLAVKSRNVQRSLTDKERADLCTEAQKEYGDWLTGGMAGGVSRHRRSFGLHQRAVRECHSCFLPEASSARRQLHPPFVSRVLRSRRESCEGSNTLDRRHDCGLGCVRFPCRYHIASSEYLDAQMCSCPAGFSLIGQQR